jgi:hypothetical protein
MGDIVVRILTVGSTVSGAPAGVVQGAVDEWGIQCGPEIGGCSASGLANGGAGKTCRTLLLTAGAGVRMHCSAQPQAP